MSHTRFLNGDSVVLNRAQTYAKRSGKLVRFTLELTQAFDANSFWGLIFTTGDVLQLSNLSMDYDMAGDKGFDVKKLVREIPARYLQ
jgi:hypothetical protein